MRRARRNRSPAATALLGLAAALALGVSIAAGLGRVPYALDMLAAFQLHVGALAAALALLAARLRRVLPALTAAAAAALCLGTADELFRAPGKPPAPGPVREIVLVSANVYGANAEPAALAEALAALDPDVLITLETPAALLADPGPLADALPFARLPETPRAPALRSAIPLLPGAERDRIGPHPDHVIATLDLGRTELAVMGLHLDWPTFGEQAWQLEDFNRFWGILTTPNLVVAGDFNAAPWSAAVDRVEDIARARIVGGVRPTYFGGVGGRGGRIPVPFGLPIDHVLVSDPIGVVDVTTHRLPGADHLAVRVRLLAPTGPPDR